MIVKLLCKFKKELSENENKEIANLLETKSLIDGDKFDKQKAENDILKNYKLHDYGEFVFNLADVKGFNPVDKTHTCVRFYGGETWVYKISFREFEEIYQTLAGKVIHDFTILEKTK